LETRRVSKFSAKRKTVASQIEDLGSNAAGQTFCAGLYLVCRFVQTGTKLK